MSTLQVWDESIFLAVNRWVGTPLDYVFGWPTFLITFLAFGIILAFMAIWEERDLFRKFWVVAAAGFCGGATAHIVKACVDRPRPLAALYDAQSHGQVLNSLFGVYVSHSFPSAHTALAFGAAAGLATVYRRRTVLFYALAAVLSFTRIYVGAHFLSDVLAGGLLGTAVGWFVARYVGKALGTESRGPLQDRGRGSLSPKYSVVVPLHNEEENVEPLWRALLDALARLDGVSEVLFIDDGSTDGTAARVRALKNSKTKWTLIRLSRRFGMAAAMQAGFDKAAGDVVITLDGDLQNDPADIPALVARLEDGLDLVCGWRRARRDSALKRLYSAVANGVQRVLLGVHIHDVGCNLRAMRREVLRDVRFSGGLHRFMAVLVSKSGYRVGEMEVRHHPRRKGRTKFGLWRRLAEGTRDLCRVAFLRPASLKGPTPAYEIGEVTGK